MAYTWSSSVRHIVVCEPIWRLRWICRFWLCLSQLLWHFILNLAKSVESTHAELCEFFLLVLCKQSLICSWCCVATMSYKGRLCVNSCKVFSCLSCQWLFSFCTHCCSGEATSLWHFFPSPCTRCRVVCACTPGGREYTGQQCHYILWLLFAGLGRGARLPWKPMSPVVLVLCLSRCAWLRSWWFQ